MRRIRKAKIVATLGPASDSLKTISDLFELGVDVFRLNFSHGDHAGHQSVLKAIRGAERKFRRPIGVIADLQGPKLRVGDFEGGQVELEPGNDFRLDLSKAKGDARRAPLPHPEVFAAIEEGTDLLLNDGRIRLRVKEHGKDYANTEVITGGTLSNRKGLNVPGVVLPLSPLTNKDRADLRFALDSTVEWIALSFVQRPEDVAEARRLIAGRAAIMVKLEKPSAITHLQELIDQADAIMVARGDLGVEMPPEDVPSLQKRIVRECREAGKPVIVATQMLESMISAPAPTRAEASDVATAIYDGADAVMLSAETAVGQYPRESVGIMNRIIRRVERDPIYRSILDAEHNAPMATPADAISAAARQVAETISASVIVTYTTSGSTAVRASRERPPVPILGLTSDPQTARRLSLVWGVHSVHTPDITNFAQMVQKAVTMAKGEEFAAVGDKLVITAGVPFGTPGATNILRIALIDR